MHTSKFSVLSTVLVVVFSETSVISPDDRADPAYSELFPTIVRFSYGTVRFSRMHHMIPEWSMGMPARQLLPDVGRVIGTRLLFPSKFIKCQIPKTGIS